MPSSPPANLSAFPRSATLWLAGALLSLLVLGRLWWLPAHAPLNVNEGWNALQVRHAFGSGSLYPAPDALTTNNYPPLSFYLVGALAQLTGDNIVAGRTVALLAELLTGAAVYTALMRLTFDRRWAVLGVFVFAGFAVTFLRSYTAINDPQWLAEAFMAWAFVLVLPQSPGKPLPHGSVIASTVLVVLGMLTKHNVVVLPLVSACWLWVFDRRALAIWIGVGLLLALVAGVGMLAVWGAAPFDNILGGSRSYSFGRMVAKGGPSFLAILPGMIACLPLWRIRGQPSGVLALLLLAIAIPVGIVQSSGDGVSVNAFFEAVMALSIALPIACAAAPASLPRRVALCALPILCLLPFAIKANIAELGGRDAAVRHWGEFISRIATAPGPVACDNQAVCYWAGREAGLDFFNIKQRLLKQHGETVRSAIANRHFSMISMRTNDTSRHADLLRPLILRYYTTIYEADDHALLVPRR